MAKAFPFLASLLLTILAFSLAAAAPPNQRTVWQNFPNEVNSNIITATLRADGEAPELMAIVVQKGDSDFDDWDNDPEAAMKKARAEATNRISKPNFGQKADPFANAKWVPFQTNVVINLGPGDGDREVLFSYRYKGQTRSDGYSGGGVTVRTTRPTIEIVNPTNVVTSQPYIQLEGTMNCELIQIHYDRYNQKGEKVVTDTAGFFDSRFIGEIATGHLERYFKCFDVDLDPGTNRIVLRFEDEAGNAGTTNIIFIFSTLDDHVPPRMVPIWPEPGTYLSGNHFTARGKCDDPSAKLEGFVMAQGQTNTISGFVERNGVFWYENIPLVVGENRLVFTATDAAGNASTTNLVVFGSDGPVITFDPIDSSKLWDASIAMKGKVSPANCDVWVNGVQAKVNQDGSWSADEVPVRSPNGGTATFEATALPKGTAQTNAKAKDTISTQASLGTNAMVLNSTSPACGLFQLHLSETAGKPFVIYASTNLTDWAPILTNANPEASFDYSEDAKNHGCRFFKVVPLR